MRWKLLAAAATFGGLAPLPPAEALPAPRKVVAYDIRVTLDDARRELSGAETLRWTNPSDVPVSELKLHLYWNAFRNNRSSFFRESGGRLRVVGAHVMQLAVSMRYECGSGHVCLSLRLWLSADTPPIIGREYRRLLLFTSTPLSTQPRRLHKP